jgi:hypothetical protein
VERARQDAKAKEQVGGKDRVAAAAQEDVTLVVLEEWLGDFAQSALWLAVSTESLGAEAPGQTWSRKEFVVVQG